MLARCSSVSAKRTIIDLESDSDSEMVVQPQKIQRSDAPAHHMFHQLSAIILLLKSPTSSFGSFDVGADVAFVPESDHDNNPVAPANIANPLSVHLGETACACQERARPLLPEIFPRRALPPHSP